MLRTLAIALLAVVVTIAGSLEAYAQTKKAAKRSAVVHANKPPAVAARVVAPTPAAQKRIAVRAPARRQAGSIRGRVASRPAMKHPSAKSKWGVGRYAPPARTIPQPHPGVVDHSAPRTLSLFNLHTRESISVTYKRKGAYVPEALARLNRFLRDSRSDTQVNVDPELFDILWLVRRRLGSSAAYHVVSAYRSPQTNAWLASTSSGVADDSLHMRGQAIDVMLPGRGVAQLRAAAVELGMGGVGYYPRTGFVHLDTGAARRW